MSLLTTMANRHQSMYSADFIITAGTLDLRNGYRLLDFNRAFPTRRHWHHWTHSIFGEPCDPICKPQRKYEGPSIIQQIKSRLRVEDIALRLTHLHGAGNVLKGKCPLHNEQKGEAFQVRLEEQDWRCWGQCMAHGDVIDLIRECESRGISWSAGSNTEGSR